MLSIILKAMNKMFDRSSILNLGQAFLEMSRIFFGVYFFIFFLSCVFVFFGFLLSSAFPSCPLPAHTFFEINNHVQSSQPAGTALLCLQIHPVPLHFYLLTSFSEIPLSMQYCVLVIINVVYLSVCTIMCKSPAWGQ